MTTKQDGVLINAGTIVSVVHGWGGTPAAGQTFLAIKNVAGLSAGQPAPGLTVSSASAVVATATWPTDPTTQSHLAKLGTVLDVTGAFPGGAATWPMKDLSGAVHNLTVTQFKAVGAAISAYVGQADLIADGLSTIVPSGTVSIT